jgi:hypothetical protein
MAEWSEIAKLLDSCYSLFLHEMGEPREGVLRLLLLEAKRSDEEISTQVGGAIIEGLYRVQAVNDSRAFELIWNQYIAYSVTSESFASANGDETDDSGRLLRCYSQSPFLDYVARTTIARKEYPGSYTHLRVLSENHIVDVVSTVSWRNIPILLIDNGQNLLTPDSVT